MASGSTTKLTATEFTNTSTELATKGSGSMTASAARAKKPGLTAQSTSEITSMVSQGELTSIGK